MDSESVPGWVLNGVFHRMIAVLGEGFLKYMEAFKPFLVMGLKNHEEHQV